MGIEAKHGKIEPPDSHYLSAAEGWFGLGDSRSALDELKLITPRYQLHPQVLHARWHIHHQTKNWEECVSIGRAMIAVDPESPQGWINHGNALFYLHRYEEAFAALYPVLDKFPADEAIPYNLACYRCQAGDLTDAVQWLKQAFKVGNIKKIRAMALTDPDLKPLWNQLRSNS